MAALLTRCGSPEATATPTQRPPTPTAVSTQTVTSPTPLAVATSTSTPAPAISPTPTKVAKPTPISNVKYGGGLSIAARENPPHYDVHQTSSAALITWGPGMVYSRLLRFKAGPDVELPSAQLECDLCEDWEVLDPTTYLFQLRPDIHWQNIPPVNGRELTAEDVAYSYQRQSTPGWANAQLLANVEDIAVVDSLTLRITLRYPDADFLYYLADARSKIVAREAVGSGDDLKAGPNIGTGPWIWTGTIQDVGSRFEPYPDYFEPELPILGSLLIQVVEEKDTRLAAFNTGGLDVHQIEAEEWLTLREKKPNAPFLAYKETGVGAEIAFKTSAPPFEDPQVRRAALLAMDPWKAIAIAWHQGAFVSVGIPALEPSWLLSEEELRPYFGDPQMARELLEEALPDLPVQVEMAVGDFGDSYMAHAKQVLAELESVGFDVSLKVMNPRVFAQDVWYGGQYTMFLGAAAPSSTPNSRLLTVVHSQGESNTHEYRNDELDLLISQQAVELDPGNRTSLIHQIQRHLLEEAVRFMPATRISVWTWHPIVQGFSPNFAGGEYIHWSRVWIKE